MCRRMHHRTRAYLYITLYSVNVPVHQQLQSAPALCAAPTESQVHQDNRNDSDHHADGQTDCPRDRGVIVVAYDACRSGPAAVPPILADGAEHPRVAFLTVPVGVG